MIRAVVFDAYGTLFDVGSLAAICEQLYPGYGVALSDAWRRKQLEYTWLLSLMGRYQDFWEVTRMALNYACGAKGLFLSEDHQRRLMQAYLELPDFPEVAVALRQLSGHYPLAILSNGTEAMLESLLEVSRLESYFTEVLSVNPSRVYKPNPKVYDLAVQAFFAVPEEIVFVSSNGWDAAGAKTYGFKVVWCNRTDQPYETHASDPDWILPNLEDLPRLLR